VSTAGLTLDCVYTANVVYGLGRPTGGLKDQTAFAAGKLSDIADGLDGEFKNGLIAIGKGLSNSPCDPAQAKPGQVDSCGIKQAAALISGGVDELVDAISESLVDVMAQAGAGAFQVAAGAGRLDSGLAALQSGAKQLDGGAGQLASGAKQLSSGLTDAASGSGQLADGLGEAAGGAPALEDGASRLSAEGTTKLVDAGKSTASDYGLKYALIEAGAERAKTEGMAYGAPAGAAGATAYSFELAAMTGEGDRNLGRGAAALALFAVGAGVAMLRRRWS
jgi:putative membrane protein